MALTATQKANIRRYLGYPDITQGSASTLEGVMLAISAEAETQIGTILTDLATIETTLRASWSRQMVTRAEDVTIAGPQEIRSLRAEGNRLARHLASVLGVAVWQFPFASGAGGGPTRRG